MAGISDIGCLCILVGLFGSLNTLFWFATLLEVKRRG